MGSAKEIDQYLKRFAQLDAARFAVVKVGGAVLRDDLDALVSSLAFLQDVGLTPIVDARRRAAAGRGNGRGRHRQAHGRRAARDRRRRRWRSCAA